MTCRHCRRLLRGRLLLALVAAACGDGSPDAEADPDPARVEMTDSAGVTIVRSLSGDRALQLETEPVLTLGGRDTPEEAFYTVARWNVGAGPDGTIHVLDRDANLVQVFDTIGRHLRTMGGQGSGPGEDGKWPHSCSQWGGWVASIIRTLMRMTWRKKTHVP
ncbi:MAG: hypothetical protein WD960_09785 [Gemmatimonadota bacterium]